MAMTLTGYGMVTLAQQYETQVKHELQLLSAKNSALIIEENQLKLERDAFSENELKETLTNMKAELHSKSALLQLVSSQAGKDRTNYSQFYIELARSITPNIWLEHIYIEGNGNVFVIKGNTWKYRELTQFMKNLQGSRTFQNVHLREYATRAVSSKPGLQKFVLATHIVDLESTGEVAHVE